MLALGAVIAEGRLPSIGALTRNELASVGPIVGERLGVPDGSDKGLSEGSVAAEGSRVGCRDGASDGGRLGRMVGVEDVT
jgi:hypothetical protein